MSYTLNYTGDEINAILARANNGGEIDDELALKAPLASPALTGNPTAPTQPEEDSSTKIATTEYADRAADAAEAAAEAAAKEYTDAATGALYITDTASGSIASFSDGADGVSMRSVKVAITPVQSGSGDPSPDNVRPISGWTGANINVSGINVWNEAWENGIYSTINGRKFDGANYVRSADLISIVPGLSYYVNIPIGITDGGIVFFDEERAFLSGDFLSRYPSRKVTAPLNARYLAFYARESTGIYQHNISINYPSSDHDYHAYAGQTFPISWQTQAGEVFGGTIDVVSGELKVDWKSVDLGAYDWGKDASNFFYWANRLQDFYRSDVVVANKTFGIGLCSQYQFIQDTIDTHPSCITLYYDASFSQTRVFIRDDTKADMTIAEFKAAMSGVMLYYKTTDVQTYHLDSMGQITSLLGQNNVWSNTGDTEVKYVADPKLYIAKMLGGSTLTLGSVSPLSVNRPVAISEEDLEQAGEVSEAVEAAAETVLPAESGETEEGAQE